MSPNRLICLLSGAAFLAASLSSHAASPADIDPKADQALKAMTRYLAGLKQFSASTESTIEVVLEDGQKIQFTVPAQITVARPNKFLAERRGDIVDQAFYYDGKTLTLFNPDSKHYATLPAPPSVDETLDFAREELDIIAPASDLIDTRAYEKLMEGATSGKHLGFAVVGGQRCHHLAYRAGDVDWQLWVREGSQPLPCKYVITSRDVAGAPQFTVQFLTWNSNPTVKPTMFDFVPPAGAQRIEFLTNAKDTP